MNKVLLQSCSADKILLFQFGADSEELIFESLNSVSTVKISSFKSLMWVNVGQIIFHSLTMAKQPGPSIKLCHACPHFLSIL